MLKIIKRISRLLALVVVYVICAYGYLTAKGFVFTDGVPVLSNHAQAKEEEFAVKVNGNVKISGAQLRARGADDAPLTMYAFRRWPAPTAVIFTAIYCPSWNVILYPQANFVISLFIFR